MRSIIAQQPSTPATSPPPIVSFPIEGIILGTGAVVLGAGFALIKWFVSREVQAWSARVGKLEEGIAQQSTNSKAIEMLNDRQNHALENLAKTVDELAKQVGTIADGQRQLMTLAERQNNFDQRLQNFGGALQELQRGYQDQQKESIAFKADLAANYIRREDWLRFSNTIDAKLDAQARRFEDFRELMLQQGRRAE